ncbi:MAG TPA: MarR family transcriptional regulator [Malonomonas sp.]
MDVTEKVLAVMRAADQPLNAGKIAELGGLERKDVDKAMTQLKKAEKIVSPKRCYWIPA